LPRTQLTPGVLKQDALLILRFIFLLLLALERRPRFFFNELDFERERDDDLRRIFLPLRRIFLLLFERRFLLFLLFERERRIFFPLFVRRLRDFLEQLPLRIFLPLFVYTPFL
jgi:hypothetical protein